MLKITIENPHWLEKDALKLTAEYLLKISELSQVRINDKALEIKELVDQYDKKNNPSVEETQEVMNETPVFNPFIAPPISNEEIELDSRGFPWDERIHARTKTKNKDGSWKYLRGVGPRVISEIENPEVPEVPELAPTLPELIPTVPQLAPTVPEFAPKTFSQLMEFITKSIIEKKLDREKVNLIIKEYEVPTLPALQHRPDLILQVFGRLEGVVNNA